MKIILILIALSVSVNIVVNPRLAEAQQSIANDGNLVMDDVPPIPEQIKNDLSRYQNVRSATFQAWAEGGKGVYITTRFGDVSQLHQVKKAGGSRQQLTFYDDPITSVSRQPGGDLLSFNKDVGGNENSQLFLLDPNTGNSRVISDGESRNGSVKWSRDGRAVVYKSTRRNGSSNDLWITEGISGLDSRLTSRMIVQATDGSWWGPGDWSADGKTMLIQQYVSVTDSRVHLLNLKTGKLTLLKGSSLKPSVNFAVAFDKTEEGYYFLTDTNEEFAKLAYQRFDQSDHVTITHAIQWDVDNVVISEDRNRIAFTVNAGGISELYLMNAVTTKFDKPENSKRLLFRRRPDGTREVYRANSVNAEFVKVAGMPIGIVSNLSFSPDGRQLALSLNTTKSPSDAYVLRLIDDKLKYGGLNRWTHSEVGGLNTDNFVEPKLIHYPTFDLAGDKQRMIPAFVYQSQKVNRPAPVIISIHGGPESQFRPSFNNTFQLWVDKLGAVVIAPNVRGSAGYGGEFVNLDNHFKREDAVNDIGALLDWIELQPNLDENRVVVIGQSYGGYMVLASAVNYSNRLRGAVDIVGISNFVTFLQNTKEYRRDSRRPEYGDERDPRMHQFLQIISPNNNVNNIQIPMLVVQGQNDPRVPVSESEQIVRALRSQGNEVWYMNALNEGHGYKKKENVDIYQQAVVMFFKKQFNN